LDYNNTFCLYFFKRLVSDRLFSYQGKSEANVVSFYNKFFFHIRSLCSLTHRHYFFLFFCAHPLHKFITHYILLLFWTTLDYTFIIHLYFYTFLEVDLRSLFFTISRNKWDIDSPVFLSYTLTMFYLPFASSRPFFLFFLCSRPT